MRKIKFRVWDKEINDWVKDTSIYFNTCIGDFDATNRDERYIYQQYVGLEDKNGMQIFEGDILQNDIEEYGYENVEWCEWRAGFAPFVHWHEYEKGGPNWEAKECKVVGNTCK